MPLSSRSTSNSDIPRIEKCQTIQTNIRDTYYNNLLKLPSRREHKNIILEQEVEKQLKRYALNNNDMDSGAQHVLNTSQGIEKLSVFQNKLLEELVRRCVKDSTTNTSLLALVDEGEECEEKPEAKQLRDEVENLGGKIGNKIKQLQQPIVGGSAKAYASAMKKMKNENHKKTKILSAENAVNSKNRQKNNPRANDLSSMILPMSTSYFTLRNQIFKLKDIISEKNAELLACNNKCEQLENDAKILRDVLSDTNSKRQQKVLKKVASTWKSLLKDSKTSSVDTKNSNNNKNDKNIILKMQDLELKLSKKAKELIDMKMEFEKVKKEKDSLLMQVKQNEQLKKKENKARKKNDSVLPPPPPVSPRLNNVSIDERKLKDEIEALQLENKKQRKESDTLKLKLLNLEKQLVDTKHENDNESMLKEKLHVLNLKLKVSETKYNDLKTTHENEIKHLNGENERMKIKYKQIDTKLNESIEKYEKIISKDMKKVLTLTSEKEKYKTEYLKLKNKIVVDEKDMVMELSRSKAKVSLLEKQVANLKVEIVEINTQLSQSKTKLLDITTKKENAEASIEEKKYKVEHHQLEIQKIQKANKAEVTIISNKLKSIEKNAAANEKRLKEEINRQKEAYVLHEQNVVKLKDELEAANLCLDVRRKERDKEKMEWNKKRLDLKRKVKELELELEQENQRFLHLMHEMNTMRSEINHGAKQKKKQPSSGGGNFFQSAKEQNRKAAQENETFQAVLKEELEIMRDAFQHKLDLKEMEKQDLLKRLNKVLQERNPMTGLYDNNFDSCVLNNSGKDLNIKSKIMKTDRKIGVFQEKSTPDIDMHLMLSAMDKKVKSLEEDNKKLVEKHHRFHNNKNFVL